MNQEDDMYLPTSDENEVVVSNSNSYTQQKNNGKSAMNAYYNSPKVEHRANVNTQVLNMMNEIKEMGDKNYHIIYRKNRGKMNKIGLFASGVRGNTIRNAVSGQRYSGHVVGSKSEDFYYKVQVSTGEINSNGDSISVFYDSPEQYEKHFGTFVEQSCKERWLSKKLGLSQ
jgi:hypothetical protein